MFKMFEFKAFYLIELILCILLTIKSLGCETVSSNDHYSESLVFKPLADGHLYAFFEFKTIWDKDLHSINWGKN